jgi:hypothetical protein
LEKRLEVIRFWVFRLLMMPFRVFAESFRERPVEAMPHPPQRR